MRSFTKAELWSRQLLLYPDSVEVTCRELFTWCDASVEGDGPELRLDRSRRRWRAISMALQYPVHVWYRLKPGGPIMGCRVGIGNPAYLSGFSDL